MSGCSPAALFRIAEGAQRHYPEQLQQRTGEPSKSKLVVCCAYGFRVGCRTAIKLREAGFDAKCMTSWRAIGAPTTVRI